MKSNYDILGNHIRLIDNRNTDSVTDRVLGINIDKFFMPSVANVIGTDLSKYKLITKGKFACNPMHVGRDERLPVALYEEDEPAIVSPAYFMFEIIDENVLDKNYLMMWFRRPEFDRICWLHTDGSVRGGITWDDICRLELPVPAIEEQREIVRSYKAITERIAIKRQINDNLEATAQAVFEDCFAEYYTGILPLPIGWRRATFSDICQIKGGKSLPAECEFASSLTSHPYVRIRDMYQGKYLELTEDFKYIDEEVFAYIRNYIVSAGDVIIAIVGITSGEIAIIGDSLDGANLTENCVKLTKYKDVTAEYLYCYWQYLRKNGGIDPLLVGAAQPKLPMYNIQSVPVIVPDEATMANYQKRAANLAKAILDNMHEIRCLQEMQHLIVSRISSR